MNYTFITYDRATDPTPEIKNGQIIYEYENGQPKRIWIDQAGKRMPPSIAGGRVAAFFAGFEINANKLVIGRDSVGSEFPKDAKEGQLFFQPYQVNTDPSLPLIVTPVEEGGKTVCYPSVSEIYAAFQTGRTIYFEMNNNRYILTNCGANGCSFCQPNNINTIVIEISSDGQVNEIISSLLFPDSEAYDLSFQAWRNGTVRGKTLTEEERETMLEYLDNSDIQCGFVGDEVRFGSSRYYIAGIHQLPGGVTTYTLVSRSILAYSMMGETDDTSGGYVNCLYRKDVRPALVSQANNNQLPFYSYEEWLVDSAVDGVPTSTGKYDVTIELLSEEQVYGRKVMSPQGSTIEGRRTSVLGQLPLFRLYPKILAWYGDAFWLRDTVDGQRFACVNRDGTPGAALATEDLGVVPVIQLTSRPYQPEE